MREILADYEDLEIEDLEACLKIMDSGHEGHE